MENQKHTDTFSPSKRVPTFKECRETYSPGKSKLKRKPKKSIDAKIHETLQSMNIDRKNLNKAEDLMDLYSADHNTTVNKSIRDRSMRDIDESIVNKVIDENM